MVADTFSSTLGVLLMGTGNDNNTWGNNVNVSDFQIFEDAIANVFTSSATSGTVDLSGTPPPAGPSQARFWQLKFTGVLTSNLTVKVPNLTKEWLINNQATTGAFAVSIQTPTGASQGLPAGWTRAWCDGNNVINLWPQGQLQNLMPGGSAAFPFYSSAVEPNSGFYRNALQDWRISVAGIDVVRFTGAGSGAPNLVDILSGNSLAFAGVKFDPTAIVPPGTVLPTHSIGAPSGYYFCDGSAKSRTTDAPLFNAITGFATGNTHGNITIDGLSTDLRGLGLEGAFIEGTGITLGTTIVSINSATSMTVSAAVSGTNTGIALRILPLGQGDGSTTFNIFDGRGVSLFGRDNMSGTAKGLLTLAQSQGILGTKLNATGGEQGHAETAAEVGPHTHINTLIDLGHGHNMQKNGGASSASITVGDPVGNSPSSGGLAQSTTATINVVPNTTGITINNVSAGSGTAHNNIPPAAICNFIVKR